MINSLTSRGRPDPRLMRATADTNTKNLNALAPGYAITTGRTRSGSATQVRAFADVAAFQHKTLIGTLPLGGISGAQTPTLSEGVPISARKSPSRDLHKSSAQYHQPSSHQPAQNQNPIATIPVEQPDREIRKPGTVPQPSMFVSNPDQKAVRGAPSTRHTSPIDRTGTKATGAPYDQPSTMNGRERVRERSANSRVPNLTSEDLNVGGSRSAASVPGLNGPKATNQTWNSANKRSNGFSGATSFPSSQQGLDNDSIAAKGSIENDVNAWQKGGPGSASPAALSVAGDLWLDTLSLQDWLHAHLSTEAARTTRIASRIEATL
jgi:hypothetical protein